VADGVRLRDWAARAGAERTAGGASAGGGAGGRRPAVFRCTDFVEKPDLATARSRLRTPGMRRDRFLAHCGIYAFAPEILDCLEELMARQGAAGRRTGAGEVQLAGAQSILLARHPKDYYLIEIAGRAYDTGTPAGYVATWKALLAASSAR